MWTEAKASVSNVKLKLTSQHKGESRSSRSTEFSMMTVNLSPHEDKAATTCMEALFLASTVCFSFSFFSVYTAAAQLLTFIMTVNSDINRSDKLMLLYKVRGKGGDMVFISKQHIPHNKERKHEVTYVTVGVLIWWLRSGKDHLHLYCRRGMFLLFFSLVGCRWSTCSCWSPCVYMWWQEEDTREGARLWWYRQVSVLILLSLYISLQCGNTALMVPTTLWLLRFQYFTSCPYYDFWLYCK